MKNNIVVEWDVRTANKKEEVNPLYNIPGGWVFRHLDTKPYYNCLVSNKTYRKIKHLLVDKYACNIKPSIYGNSDTGDKMWVLERIM